MCGNDYEDGSEHKYDPISLLSSLSEHVLAYPQLILSRCCLLCPSMSWLILN